MMSRKRDVASRGFASTITITQLTHSFGGPNILDGINLNLEPGSFTALLGRSGSGKSTLLRLLAGLDRPTTGTVVTPPERAVVFQEPRLVPWKRVWQNVILGLRAKNPRERALRALNEVNLSSRIEAWPLTLSGGEAQRVALARALVREPMLLLLDEPFAALDALTRIKMHELVLALWREHRPTILIVTHDVDEAIVLADRVLILTNGNLSLDLPVTAPRPRRPSSSLEALRQRLLAELGVASAGESETLGDRPTHSLRALTR
jgi:sulfonate transport system ATP-binding protein